MKVGIIGYGVVGKAMNLFFINNGFQTVIYDKYISDYSNQSVILDSHILFLSLPTLYDEVKKEYDTSAIHQNLAYLTLNNYQYPVVIRSTLTPGTTNHLSVLYSKIHLVHCPEFLSSMTAYRDVEHPKKILLGHTPNTPASSVDYVYQFMKECFPSVQVDIIGSLETESVKIFSNSFYAIKVQFFNELYNLCEHKKINYELVKTMMIQNGWIYPLHTQINNTGTFGGACLPKDIKALYRLFEKEEIDCDVIKGTVNEHDRIVSKFFKDENENM